MIPEKRTITPGYVHAPENPDDAPENVADVRLTDDASVQVDVLPLGTTSEPVSDTPDTRNGD